MMFEGKFNIIVLEEVAEVARDDRNNLYVTHKSGAKTTTHYDSPSSMDKDYGRLVEALKKLHAFGIQFPR